MTGKARFLAPALVVLLTAGGNLLQGAIETAGEVFVDLDSRDDSAGGPTWVNNGTLGDFNEVGDPVAEIVAGVKAVTFGAGNDAYQCVDNAPAGLTGQDPTRSIEVWAFNPEVADEETLVAWGHRGGPDGSNMSFNYGKHAAWGAVGHWGAPDIGWGDIVTPKPGMWHHLVYTYDGTTTRVYSDGVLRNSEELGPGAINTHPNTKITIAAQLANAASAIDFGQKLTGSIARVRVHDGVLTPEQILANYEAEKNDFASPPSFVRPPTEDTAWVGSDLPYMVKLEVVGIPKPTLEVIEPSGATINEEGLLTYTLPDPPPASFTVTVRATNTAGTAEASWEVTVKELPPAGELAIAGELFVDLSADDPSAATPTWVNDGTLGDFVEIGDPVEDTVAGAKAVRFNQGGVLDAYQQPEEGGAPAGLIGPDPTYTIEAWVFNEEIATEETIVAWGKRGGPCGSNMSFNYGSHPDFGAIGHWCSPDIGWGTVPVAGQWHHLATTYDGATTRVYVDGVETNNEYLGPGVINIHGGTKITVAAQIEPDGINLNFPLRGVLAVGKLRIHDGVLSLYEIRHNYQQERPGFPLLPPKFLDAPLEDFYYADATEYVRVVNVSAVGTPTLEVLEPSGVDITQLAPLTFEIRYPLPDPKPGDFTVSLRITDDVGTAEAGWPVHFVQPADLAAGPVHRYSFTEDATDSVGGADGTPYGDVVFQDGQAVLRNDGSQRSNDRGLFPDPANPDKPPPGAYIDLPNGIISALGPDATFETWITWYGPTDSSWQRIFDFGTSDEGEDVSPAAPNSTYIFMTPRSGPGTLRAGYRDGPTAAERWVETGQLADGVEQHVVLTWDGDDGRGAVVRLYVNGRLVAEDSQGHISLPQIPDVNNWLGRAQWNDPLLNGQYNEFRIYNYALSPDEVLGNFEAGPDTITAPPPGTPVFVGDANCDGSVDIADAVCTLGHLFGSTEDPCKEPCCTANMDANDDGSVDISDPVKVLSFLFAGDSLIAPDAGLIPAGATGCFLYPVEDVTLPCTTPCTP